MKFTEENANAILAEINKKCWENDIQIELRYIAAVLAISDNDRDKIDAIISF